jgi:hypothetical protein
MQSGKIAANVPPSECLASRTRRALNRCNIATTALPIDRQA